MSVQAVKDADFETEVIKSELPVFVDLWAEWCGPCRALSPIVEELSGDYAGRIKFVKVNVDENPGIAQAFNVRSIPMLAVLKGNTVLDMAMGLQPKETLSQWLDAVLEHIAGGHEAPETPEA